jgi:hypothetical protein
MSDKPNDANRIAELKKLDASGPAGGKALYLSHLIGFYTKLGILTSAERKRVDEFLESHCDHDPASDANERT